MKQYRYAVLLFLIAGIPKIGLHAQSKSLAVAIDKDGLQVSARQLRFLSDKELKKLHNGLTVNLIIDLTAATDGSKNPLYRAQERFAFSFDLWEEKYTVYHSPPDGQSISHLTAAEAEGWCLKNLIVPLDRIPEQNVFMIQLECFIDESDEENNRENSPGLTIADIVEYFSRRKSEGPNHWKISTGPLRLDDLKRK